MLQSISFESNSSSFLPFCRRIVPKSFNDPDFKNDTRYLLSSAFLFPKTLHHSIQNWVFDMKKVKRFKALLAKQNLSGREPVLDWRYHGHSRGGPVVRNVYRDPQSRFCTAFPKSRSPPGQQMSALPP